MHRGSYSGRSVASVGFVTLVAAIAGFAVSSEASSLCVNPGAAGCYTTITAAVSAASSGDTIFVAAGTYKEAVVIGMPLSLVGANSANTVIDATGQPNGIYVDGMDNPGLHDVSVSGFTVKNAQFEGILVTNASAVSLHDNHVVDNDLAIQPSVPACPGIPDFETLESFDCGEGIHLLGVAYSTVANNFVDHNAGGILLSDDTGATHDNLVVGNTFTNNPYDCGITLASHPDAFGGPPAGVFHNTIAQNESSSNGLMGEGAGVGIFASIPGTKNYGNIVINNVLTRNGLPGVAMHSHAPGQDLTNNLIAGNYVSRNGADTDDAATPGPTGINVFAVSPASGTVISQNVIDQEDVAVAVNTSADVAVHLNDFRSDWTGVGNLGAGVVPATENWWGCSGGPTANGCSNVMGSVLFAPWLTKPYNPSRSAQSRAQRRSGGSPAK